MFLKKLLVFLFLNLISLPLFAQSGFQSVMTWDSQGFSQPRSCWVTTRAFNSEQVASAWLNGFEVGDLPPVARGGQLVDLSGSEWQMLASGNQAFYAYCDFTRRYLLIEVAPQRGEELLVGVEQKNLSQLEEFIEDTEDEMDEIASDTPDSINGVEVVDGSLEYVVCTTSSRLNVRNESLNQVIFQADRFEELLPVQSFGQDRKQLQVGSKTYTYIQAQFPARSDRRGWVAEDFIKPRGQCPGLQEPQKPIVNLGWQFPTVKRPSSSYKTGARRFKANRGGGSRYHAACDLYRVRNEEVVSVNGGQVIRDTYFFYQGTYAIEVRHTDGRVMRYGEITSRKAPGVRLNSTVDGGQVVGYIGKVNSGCCTPMLHFEMYSGQGSGPLSQSGNKFRRRWDLQDPTSDLVNWEFNKFGVSY